MAGFPRAVVAGVGPDVTVAGEPVVPPVAWALWSTAPVPAAVDRPAYSLTAMPMSALAVVVAVTVTGVLPPATAVHTLSWVRSDPVTVATFVNTSPALSVTPLVVGPAPPHSATSTTSRSPGVVPPVVLTGKLVVLATNPEACWTKAGGGLLVGVTAPDAAEAGPVPMALVADTVNVYAVPLVRPATVADVAGGLPPTRVGAWAVPPTYGVSVYEVIGLPPLAGAVQLTVAEPLPGTAFTPVGAAGAVGGRATVDSRLCAGAVTRMSAAPGAVGVRAGDWPAPAVTGAVQTLSSVPSDALPWDTSTKLSPAESLTPVAVPLAELQTPTSTTSRSPVRSAVGSDTARLPVWVTWPPACWTNAGAGVADGVTPPDGTDAGDVPAALVALTVNVYAVPLVRPPTVVEVDGGLLLAAV